MCSLAHLARIVYFGLFQVGLQSLSVSFEVTLVEKSIHTEQYALFLNALREARVRAGVTQIELASRLEATQTFVSKCERGERRLDVVELAQWCAAVDISLTEFVARLEELCKKPL